MRVHPCIMAEQTRFEFCSLPENDQFSLQFKSTVSETLFRFGNASRPVAKIRDKAGQEFVKDGPNKYSHKRSVGECAWLCVLVFNYIYLMFLVFVFHELRTFNKCSQPKVQVHAQEPYSFQSQSTAFWQGVMIEPWPQYSLLWSLKYIPLIDIDIDFY